MSNRQIAAYKKTIDRFQRAKVCVVGDLMVDLYVYATARKISHEEPVLVGGYERELPAPGGAANAAMNLRALGATVIPVGIVGEDGAGRDLVNLFLERGIPVEGVVKDPRTHTITKTRFLVGEAHGPQRQVFRLDRDPAEGMDETPEKKVLEALDSAAREADAILVSDYAIRSERWWPSVRRLAAEGSFAVTATSDRLQDRMIQPAKANGERHQAHSGRTWCAWFEPRSLWNGRRLAPRDRGWCFRERNFTKRSRRNEVGDVTGMGDTVSAVATLALAAGAAPLAAAHLANFAAGVVVMKRGTRALAREELLEAIVDHHVREGGG
jgi:bifunctional ADP-heptose synthase (sugar kinase/adenylyltransferase)